MIKTSYHRQLYAYLYVWKYKHNPVLIVYVGHVILVCVNRENTAYLADFNDGNEVNSMMPKLWQEGQNHLRSWHFLWSGCVPLYRFGRCWRCLHTSFAHIIFSNLAPILLRAVHFIIIIYIIHNIVFIYLFLRRQTLTWRVLTYFFKYSTELLHFWSVLLENC